MPVRGPHNPSCDRPPVSGAPCDRRRVLGLTLAAGGLMLAGMRPAAAQVGARRLDFYSLHTGEKLRATYWENGRYLTDGLREIDFNLRDFRTGDVHPIDPELLDLLYRLRRAMDYDRPISVISGYRCPATNAMLAARSNRVAKNSYHVRGMAIDIRLPGRQLSSVRESAMALARGGVGYYPESEFVHVDTGPVRAW
jgi:uncharacterized protein YcbK (DUF882 family)